MTNIKVINGHIVFDGHADTKQACEVFTSICNSLACDKNFKTVRYEKGFADFEVSGKCDELMFAPGGNEYLTINFDANVTKVVVEAQGGTITCTESGSTYDNATYYFNSANNPPVFTVTLKSGYVLDSVDVDDDSAGGSATITSSTTFEGTNICSSGNCMLTITSKLQNSSTKKVKTRVQTKHDTTVNWAKATTFVPLAGEIVAYDDLNRFKIGDGATTVVNLPFFVNKRFEDGVLAYEDVSVYNKNDASGQHTKYKKGSITQVVPSGMSTTEYTLSFPYTNGILATTDTVVANPSGDGTSALSKIKINNTIYTISGGSSGSGDVTAAGDNLFTGQNTFSNTTTINGTLNAGDAIFSDVVTINEASIFGTSPTITDTVYGDSQPGLWLQGLDNEQPRYIHLYAEGSEITSDHNLKIPCKDGIIATTDQIPTINTVLSSGGGDSLGTTIDTISPRTGTNYVVNYPYKQLKTAKVINFSSGIPNTTINLSSIVGQPTMDYTGATESTDSLPSNTSAIFEVYFDCWFYGTNSTNIYIKSNLYGISSDANSRQALVSGYSRFGQNSFVMPISRSGSITVSGDTSVTSGALTIYGYRRIR